MRRQQVAIPAQRLLAGLRRALRVRLPFDDELVAIEPELVIGALAMAAAWLFCWVYLAPLH